MTRKKTHPTIPQWNWKSRQELDGRLLDSYGDRRAPRRDFVFNCERRDPYRATRAELATVGELTDDTDDNCDVCFTYVVTATPSLVVKLSMVGPYALVQAIDDGATLGLRPRVIASADGASTAARELLRILERHDLMLLSEPMLAEPVDLQLTDVADPTVYNALFAPEEAPWVLRGAKGES